MVRTIPVADWIGIAVHLSPMVSGYRALFFYCLSNSLAYIPAGMGIFGGFLIPDDWHEISKYLFQYTGIRQIRCHAPDAVVSSYSFSVPHNKYFSQAIQGYH